MKSNKKLQIRDFYILRNYDGGNGLQNTISSIVTYDKKVAEAWCSKVRGNDYIKYTCVVAHSVNDLEDAEYNIERAKILEKLTDREKELLGLNEWGCPTINYR